MILTSHTTRTIAEWLALREGRVTSSLVAGALGLDPYCTPLEAWCNMTGRSKFDGNKNTQRGTYLEDVVLEYPTRGGHLRRKPAPFRTGAHWSGDSTDCLYTPGSGQLILGEGKTVNGARAREYGQEGTDQIPRSVLVQCYWHLLHWPDADTVIVPVLVGDQFEFVFREYVVRRDVETIGLLAQQARRFWRDYVQADKPPPAQFRDAEALKVAWPSAFKGKTVEPTPELHALVLDKLAAQQERIAAAKAEKGAEARIRQLLEDAEGVFGDGWKATWTNNKGSEVTDWEALALELGATDADVERHTRVRPGPRVLRCWKKKPKKGDVAA